MWRVFTIIIFSCFCQSSGFAQADRIAGPLQVGLGLAGNSYIGDLTEQGSGFMRFYPGGNASLQFDGRRPLKFQLSAGFGSFSEQADKDKLPAIDGITPNNYVETTFFYIDLRLNYFFFNRERIRPYLGVGIGLFSFQPEDELGNFLGENIFTRLPEESYGSMVASFPLILGVQGRLNNMLSLGLDYTYRITASDYLDNIGILGNRAGNDDMHALQFTVYFVLGQKPDSGHRGNMPEPQKPALNLSPLSVSIDWLLEDTPDATAELTWLEKSVEPVNYSLKK